MKRFAIALALTTVSPSVFATDISGTWKLLKQECLSGAPAKAIGNGFQGSFDDVVVVTETELISKITLTAKYDKAYADGVIKQLAAALVTVGQMPDGPDKQKLLAEVNDSLRVTQQYAKGITCVTNETDSYTLEGTTLRVGPATKRSSTCPGDNSEADQKIYSSVIELKGNILKITDADAETGDENTCAKGDKTVTTFTRLN